MECPACGTIHRLNRNTSPAVWTPRTGLFRCHQCKIVFGLGVLAYPIQPSPGDQRPDDWSPTFREALALRQVHAPGVLMEEGDRQVARAVRNVVLVAGCSCEAASGGVLWVHPNCPVHGHGRPA